MPEETNALMYDTRL